MKVLHVVNAYSAGGMENGIANLTHGLYEKGIVTDVCALTRADEFARRLHWSVNVFELERKKGIDFNVWLKLKQLILKNSYDIIHTHNWTGMIYGVLPSLLAGVPVIHGEHSELFDWERHSFRIQLRKLFYRWCGIVHVISHAQLLQLQSNKILEGIDALAISNGTDVAKFSPHNQQKARLQLGLPEDGIMIGIVGRLVETKRHNFLLDSFLEAGKKVHNLHLVIAGSGGNLERQIFDNCKYHPLSKRIHWLGARDDMPSVYNSLNFLIIPSINEGMTNVALEAMACGIPVVANQVCGISQIIDHRYDGVVIPMYAPANLAEAIIEISKNGKELSKLGERARLKIVKHFSLNCMVDQYALAYGKLLNNKPIL